MSSKYIRRNCSQGTVREEITTSDLTRAMNGIDIKRFLLKESYEYEVKRFQELSNQYKSNTLKKNINIRSQWMIILKLIGEPACAGAILAQHKTKHLKN